MMYGDNRRVWRAGAVAAALAVASTVGMGTASAAAPPVAPAPCFSGYLYIQEFNGSFAMVPDGRRSPSAPR